MSILKVDAIRSNSATSDAITLDGNGKCAVTGTTITADTGKFTNLPNRNLIINGAMQVAQRGTSSTSDGYQTVDRFQTEDGGANEAGTREQVDVASGTTPYTLGFRKALKFTNGNQTSGADAGDYIAIWQHIEAQNIVCSGWNYTSSSSYITLSFWVKSSVAKTFLGLIRTHDGTNYNYPYSTGAISADTWTKVTKTIPGNSNLVFNNDNGAGLTVEIWPYIGTSYTDSSVSLDAWKSYSGSARTPVDTGTNFWTTDNATFEITGVQLEVGDTATNFEHRSFSQELQLCKRYYEQTIPKLFMLGRYSHHNGAPYSQYHFSVEKRTAPTCSSSGTFESSTGYAGSPSFTDTFADATTIYGANSVTAGGILYLHTGGSGNGVLKFSAEL